MDLWKQRLSFFFAGVFAMGAVWCWVGLFQTVNEPPTQVGETRVSPGDGGEGTFAEAGTP
jgi:hypothetical protein